MVEERGWGRIRPEEEKVFCLTYADKMVLLVESGKGIVHKLEKMEGIVGRKKLEVNVEKTKVMRLRKEGGRMTEVKWRWKGKGIEEVREYSYLGFRMQRKGGQEAHVRERVKKAGALIRQVWRIEKRRFAGDWVRRIWIFERLVGTVME